MLEFLRSNPKYFDDLISFCISHREPHCWRSAWLIGHLSTKNDKRITPYVGSMIEMLDKTKDGHQRELLKILNKSKLTEEQESQLFDACINIWSEIGKSPSVRITAFKILASTSNKYPPLKNELKLLTQPHFFDDLTPGIRRSFLRLAEDL